jgi:hypothetical protein
MKGEKGKAPSVQWYYKDWLSDKKLQMASPSTRGIWMNLLMYMIDCPLGESDCSAGELTLTTRRICQLGGCLEPEAELFIEEALELKFCDISVTQGGTVTVMSRRLSRDDKRRRKWRERKEKQRARSSQEGDVHQDVPQVSTESPDVSPFPTPTKKKKKKKKKAPKKGGAKARKTTQPYTPPDGREMASQYPEWNVEAWDDYLVYRKGSKWPLTEVAVNRLVAQIKDWPAEKQRTSIDKTITHGYRGLFDPDEGRANQQQQGQSKSKGWDRKEEA